MLAGCCANGDGRGCCVCVGDACIGHEVVTGGAGVCNGGGKSLVVGGLQEDTEVAKGNSKLEVSLTTLLLSGPAPQASQPLKALLPFMAFARVAASKCLGAFALQVPLLWWRPIL